VLDPKNKQPLSSKEAIVQVEEARDNVVVQRDFYLLIERCCVGLESFGIMPFLAAEDRRMKSGQLHQIVIRACVLVVPHGPEFTGALFTISLC